MKATTLAILGNAGVELSDHDGEVAHAEFSQSINDEMQSRGFDSSDFMDKLPEHEMKRRRDMRHELVMTIDPTTSRDFDDALHVKQCDDGDFEVGIHIADVSYFVVPGSELDNEARLRCATTYLQGFSVPMLPRELSENLCSLNPGVDRCAFSVIVKMKPDGTFDDNETWFGRTLINNKCRMDYQTAQRIIDGIDGIDGKEGPAVTAESGLPEEYQVYNSHGPVFSTADVVSSIKNLRDLAVELQRMGKKTEIQHQTKMTFTTNPASGLPDNFVWR